MPRNKAGDVTIAEVPDPQGAVSLAQDGEVSLTTVEIPVVGAPPHGPYAVLDLGELLRPASYPGTLQALTAVSLQRIVEAGGAVRIVGQTQSGQAAALLIAAGYPPQRIGALLIGSEVETRESIETRERRELAIAEAQAREANWHPSK